MTPPPEIRYTATCAVIVTYGDRAKLLAQVVDRVLANGIGQVVIVDNGSTSSSRSTLQSLAQDSCGLVSLVSLDKNQGSAGGFKAGLEHAQGLSACEYIWLLDDDNCPDEDALTELVMQHELLRRAVAIDQLALVSLRENWPEHKFIAEGGPVRKAFPRCGSFLGFHIFTPPSIVRRLFKCAAATPSPSLVRAPREIPYGPYGGLFFHKCVTANIGYPDERFFAYSDDTEYTLRLTRSGGKLFLVPASVVSDMQPSWHVLDSGETLFSHLLRAASDFRIFYATRNQSYLENHVWPKHRVVYQLNRGIFFLLLNLMALWHGRWQRAQLVARAVRQGRLAKLGRAADF